MEKDKEKLLIAIMNNYNKIIYFLRKKKMCLRYALIMHGRIKRKKVIILKQQIKRKYRRFWTCVETSNFWEVEVPKLDEESFKNKFRVNRVTFDYLVKKLQHLAKNDTFWRFAIPLQKRLGIALYTLGSSLEYRTIASLFGVGRTTVGQIVIDVCRAICTCLKRVAYDAYPPTDSKIKEIVSGFERLGFPQCYGAIDGYHIEVKPYSVVLFASVDHRYRFTYINVGAPGRSNDLSIFEFKLKHMHEANETLRRHTKIIEGVEVPVLLIGDSAFPLSKFVMKPFPFNAIQNENEELFNKRLSSCRRVVENAFAHLNYRFRRVAGDMKVHMKNINVIVKAVCILHNICNNNNDHINKNWMKEYSSENVRQQPSLCPSQGNNCGIEIRNALLNYVSRTVLVDGVVDEEVAACADDCEVAVNGGIVIDNGSLSTSLSVMPRSSAKQSSGYT